MPLAHTDVSLDVRGLVASTTVVQRYANTTDQAIQAVYVFPLPHDAAVYDIEVKVGRRVRRRYQVELAKVIQPEDVTFLRPTTRDVLTLLACYPFGLSPISPQRYVVRAGATEARNGSDRRSALSNATFSLSSSSLPPVPSPLPR